jgi:hypothetical protein
VVGTTDAAAILPSKVANLLRDGAVYWKFRCETHQLKPLSSLNQKSSLESIITEPRMCKHCQLDLPFPPIGGLGSPLASVFSEPLLLTLQFHSCKGMGMQEAQQIAATPQGTINLGKSCHLHSSVQSYWM